MTHSAINSIYVHIPFCEHFCAYCHFIKVPLNRFDLNAYVSSLIKEIQLLLKPGKAPLDTFYIGGGTPSLLQEEHLVQIMEAVHCKRLVSKKTESTLEANPIHITAENLTMWLRAGFNRLSVGVQSFQDVELKRLGRDHDAESAHKVVLAAAETGFRHVSIDLLCGMKGQTWGLLKNSITLAVALPIDHISLYILDKPGMTDPRVNHVSGLYEKARIFLREEGFQQYEISNFARPGGQSRHNRVYWRNGCYYGFGAAASGFDGVRECRNEASISKYNRLISEKGHACARAEKPDPDVRRVVTGLRLRAGIPETALIRYKRSVDFLVENGVLERRLGRVRITESHILQTNSVLAELI